MTRPNDTDAVKELLKDRIEVLCARLLPDGRRQGRLWVSYNPVTGDHKHSTPEFKVALTGNRGAWKDWRSGDKGDCLKLISYIKGLDFPDTMRFARDFLGLSSLSADDRRRMEADARRKKVESDREAERQRLWKIGRAEQLFNDGALCGARSAAERHGRAYFAARQCPLEAVQTLDEATFRFSGSTEYWRLARYESQNGRRVKRADGPRYPAIHSAFRAPTGQVMAVHCTFLDPVRPAKLSLAGADSAKLIFGEAKGSVIRISHGPEGVPPELALQAHPLILCEGIETGLSLAAAAPEARVWAGGSLSNMGNAPVWMDCVSAVVLARDNNDGNRQAERQLEAVIEALAAHGKRMTVINSPIGDDFNDLAKGDDQ